jgi:hypothetical protein
MKKQARFLIFILLIFIFGCRQKGSEFLGIWRTTIINGSEYNKEYCKIRITKESGKSLFFIKPIGKLGNCSVVGFYTLTKEGNLQEFGTQSNVRPSIITYNEKNKQIITGYLSWDKLEEADSLPAR